MSSASPASESSGDSDPLGISIASAGAKARPASGVLRVLGVLGVLPIPAFVPALASALEACVVWLPDGVPGCEAAFSLNRELRRRLFRGVESVL